MQYRSIIEHSNSHKISDRQEVEVTREFTFSEETFSFVHPEYGKMKIVMQGSNVLMSYGNTKMEMIYNQKHHILYNTIYGPIEMDVYLKKISRTNSYIHLVYYLYDGDSILSKCYLMLDEINPILS